MGLIDYVSGGRGKLERRRRSGRKATGRRRRRKRRTGVREAKAGWGIEGGGQLPPNRLREREKRASVPRGRGRRKGGAKYAMKRIPFPPLEDAPAPLPREGEVGGCHSRRGRHKTPRNAPGGLEASNERGRHGRIFANVERRDQRKQEQEVAHLLSWPIH